MRLTLFLALACGLGAQRIPFAEGIHTLSAWPTAVADRSAAKPSLLKNGWRPGQSAAIGPESGGDRENTGKPWGGVESPAQVRIDFVGGGVDGDTQARAMVPRGCRLSGSDHPAARRDGDLLNKSAETRQSGDRIEWVVCRENGSLNSGQREDERRTAPISPWLSTIRSAGSTPARLHQITDRAGWWQRHLGDTIAHGAATTADIASSRGLAEVNPILRDSRGQLGARGIAIKYGAFVAIESAKWALLRRGHRGAWVRALSLGPAGVYGAVAAHNWRLR